jgi:hypothetical protein
MQDGRLSVEKKIFAPVAGYLRRPHSGVFFLQDQFDRASKFRRFVVDAATALVLAHAERLYGVPKTFRNLQISASQHYRVSNES